MVRVVVEESQGGHSKCRAHQGGDAAAGNTLAEAEDDVSGKAVV